VSGKTALDGTRFGGNLGPAYAIPAATGVILGAVYLLYWAGRVVFGPLKEPAHDSSHHEEDAGTEKGHQAIRDLSPREWAVLIPMAAMVIYMGVYPKLVVNSLQPPVAAINSTFTTTPAVADAPAMPATEVVAQAPPTR
jgi:NADH-quinone oxidoreductase subunit M